MRSVWLSLVLVYFLVSIACRGVTKRHSEGVSFIDDQSGLIDRAARGRISKAHALLLRDLDIHFKIVTLKEPVANIHRTSHKLFETYALGAQTRAARGVLLLVDSHSQRVRLEVGYDLESVFPDSFVSQVLHDQFAPYFARGQPGGAIEATVELLVSRALRFSSQLSERHATARKFSGGGGATAATQLTTRNQPSIDRTRYDAQATVLGAIDRYLELLSRQIKETDLGLYTDATQTMLAKQPITDGQQATEFRMLQASRPGAKVFRDADRAVIRFSSKLLAPYLLKQGTTGWALDFAEARHVYRFNHLNQWRFTQCTSSYAFAFKSGACGAP